MSKRTKQDKPRQDEIIKKKRTLKPGVVIVLTIIILALAVYLSICLIFPNSGVSGTVGLFIFNTLLGAFGGSAFLIPIALVVHALMNKSDIKSGKVKYRWVFSLLLVIFTGTLVHAITYPNVTYDTAYKWYELVELGRAYKGGGGISGGLGQTLVNWFGPAGTIIFTIVLIIVLLGLFLGVTPSVISEKFSFYINRQSEKRVEAQRNMALRKEEREKRRAELEEIEIKREIQRSYKQTNNHDDNDNFFDVPLDESEEEDIQTEKSSDSRYPKDMPSDDVRSYQASKNQTSKLLNQNFFKPSTPKKETKVDYSDYLTKNKIITSYVTPIPTKGTGKKEQPNKETVVLQPPKEEILEEVFSEHENKEIYDKFTSDNGSNKEESYYNETPDTKAEIQIETPKEPIEEEYEEEIIPVKEPVINRRREPVGKEVQEKVYEKPYVYPKIELLNKPERRLDTGTLEDEVQLNAEKLVEVLEDFNIQTHVVGISKGPKVTRYDVELERGVRVRSLLNCVDDISYALATNGVRITGVVPGKSAIGIEVPNSKSKTVYMREMIDTDEFRNLKTPVSVSLGINVPGEKIYMDISKMPHLLVAGTTGSGKSVLLHTFIISMLYRARPDEVKFIMIDPKRVEFNLYKGLPHLVVPIISEPKKAAGALHWATQEMDRRFGLIENENVRDFKSYNEAVKNDPTKEKLASMVIIIDEFADLMMQAPAEVETSICRIAQKARAAGIHLVIGTQRPTVNVVTGLIKANIPSRISLMVANANESRIIIDETGANNLLGQGDMLYKPVGASSPERIQGAWVSDKEIENVVKFIIKNNGGAEGYDTNITEQIEKAAELCDKKAVKSPFGQDEEESSNDSDPMLKKAIEIAVKEKKISASLLQRRLSLGFSRASKLIDIMEERNIVSAPDGQKPRNVLITEAEYAEMCMREDTNDEE